MYPVVTFTVTMYPVVTLRVTMYHVVTFTVTMYPVVTLRVTMYHVVTFTVTMYPVVTFTVTMYPVAYIEGDMDMVNINILTHVGHHICRQAQVGCLQMHRMQPCGQTDGTGHQRWGNDSQALYRQPPGHLQHN